MTTAGWDDQGRERLAEVMARQIEAAITTKHWRPLPHQVPPSGDWLGWLMLAGRGAGKTAACAKFVVDHVHGKPCMAGPTPHWIGIIAPTLGDAATSAYAGPAGIRTFDPEATMKQAPGGLIVTWPNGSQAKMFGAREPDDVERLRSGGNTCLVWCEELAAWRYLDDAWDQMRFGLRVGTKPRWIASTTPKPRALIKKLAKGEYHDVVLTVATMYDNPHLPEHIREALVDAYGQTTIGAQELYGRIVEQDENALWNRENIETHRTQSPPDNLTRIEVGVDPSGGAGEQGIVVVGTAPTEQDGKILRHGYVLDDRTVRLKPEGWGRAAVNAAVDWDANAIVVEVNFGGDMAVSTITTAAEQMGIHIPVKTQRASRGKRPRSEPVSVLATQGRWWWVGEFPELEDQACTWTTESDYSPDRLDAMVWPAWHMRLVTTTVRAPAIYNGADMVKRRIGIGRRR